MDAPGTANIWCDSRWRQGGPDKRKQRIIRAYQLHVIDDETLWRLLSGNGSPLHTNDAAEVYRALGLVPFSGYPLQTLRDDGPLEELDDLREEVEHAHQVLTELGAGKEHWSLAGRIHALVQVWAGMTQEQRLAKLSEYGLTGDKAVT